MNAFFTGWCLCGILWCVDTNDYGWHLYVFTLGAAVNGVAWYGQKSK